MNQICIIDGKFMIVEADDAKEINFKKLLELVEHYRLKLKNNLIQLPPESATNSNQFQLTESLNGSEVYQSLLHSLGISDIDSQLQGASETPGAAGPKSSVAIRSLSDYVCFIIADFDQEDSTFLKLEEIQSKLGNLFNTLSQASTTSSANLHQAATMAEQKRFIIYGWPILYHCIENNLNLTSVTDVDRPLYCKLMSGCFVCFTGFRKENKNTVAHCIKLVHYMGGSVRKEYNKKITHLIVKSTLSTKYKTAYNIGKCHLLTEDWIIESWKHRNEISFNVNNEEFLKRFKLKALYSLSIAFYGFTKEETQHMKEVTIENGGTPINDINDPQCTHIVINDQEVKQLPSICSSSVLTGTSGGDDAKNSSAVGQTLTTTAAVTPTSKSNVITYLNTNMSPFSNTRASIVRTEWFWASIQICCRASECLYEFTKPKTEPVKQDGQDPPTKRIKLSLDNLLSHETLNSSSNNGITHTDSPHNHTSSKLGHHTPTSTSGPLSTTSSSLLTSALNNSTQKAAATVNKLASSNNLLSAATTLSCPAANSANGAVSSCEYDSPTIVSNSNTSTLANTTNHRLSTNRVNMSNNNLSTSASLLDATADDAMSIDSPFEKHTRDSAHGILNSASSNGASNSKKVTKRSQRIYELYETEKRFVNILHTIIYYFKEPIEEPDQVAGPILDQTEVREIFGNLPPIYEVHCKIKDRLERLVNRLLINEEATSVGEIYMDNSEALLKTYPPFVNFYEKTKDAILNCDKIKPRFHAFLKIAQSKPECGRQTLVELLIRPVQRLPSTLLLLDDILKETPKQHRDHDLLSKAIASLKEVMTHINEDKRKIENQLAMFVLINDIENCPATLLSSHRSFVKKVDVHEMSNELLKKGAPLTLFLFTDCLEICKPRTKLINASKSPVSKQRTPQKCYKHISLFSLNNITKVCDILQKGDDTDLFGILCRLAGEKDKFFSFKVLANSNSMLSSGNAGGQPSQNCSMVTSNSAHNGFGASSAAMLASTSTLNYNNYSSIYASSTNLHNSNNEYYQAVMEKKDYLKLLAQGICNVKCITEYENILCTVEAQQLQIDLNESGGLKKLDAVKSYARRVSRAFSFQDTPNKIKKTISSVFRSPFQSYSQQSLNEQKASKLTSLASLQLTPTLMETKRKFITLQKSTLPLISPPKAANGQTNGGAQSQAKRSSNHPMHLLSTRTLRSLRSTTTSTINGIAAAMSSGGSSSKMSHYYSSIKHKNSNSEKKDKNKLLKKQESAQLPNGDQIKYPSYEDDDENCAEDIGEFDDIVDDEVYDENDENLVKPSSVKRTNAYAHDDQQSMASEFDANNLDQENMEQHQYYKQQLNINKSKKQILMTTGTSTVTSSSHFSNISNKVCRKMDTL